MKHDPRTGIGIFVGSMGAICAGAGLVAVRDHFAQVNAVLILVFFVLLGAVIGGRLAGAVSALTAAVAFDFFYTQPYNSLKVNSAADVETTFLLLAVGLAMGEIVVRADRIRSAVSGRRQEIDRVHRVARLAADGAAVDDLIAAVSAELTATLGLRQCTYERPPFTGSYARLEPTGLITGTNMVQYTKQGYELPRTGVDLPVVVHDETVARFVLIPTPGHGVSIEARLVALTLADQLSLVLGSPVA
ncbi:MAG TPA: DUF4118 domain-containing protein [Acidimicrobiales bacterium]|jgi:hypothetical protein|nr:DUF4118 domain-containing protein [Acidimicrobiales bacterium]